MKQIRFLFLLFPIAIYAQPKAPNALKELVNASFTYAPKMAELETQSAMAAAKTDYMSSYLMPSINAFGTYNYLYPIGQVQFPTGPGQTLNINFQPNNNVNLGLNASYLLLDFGRARAVINKSKEELKTSKLNIDQAKSQIATQVAGIYFSMASLQQSISIEDSLLLILEENLDVTQKRVSRGDALQMDVMNLHSTIDLEKNRKSELQAAFNKQKILLEYVSGKSPASLELSFTVDEQQELMSLLQQAELQNPDFAVAKSRLEASRLEAKQLEKSFLPTLSINAGTGFRNGYQPDIYEMKYNYAVGFSLNAPLYQGGRSRIQKRINGSALHLNELAIDQIQKATRRDLMTAQSDLLSAKERLSNAEQMVENAKEAVRVGEVRYANGTATHTDLMNAISNLQRVHLNVVNYTYQVCIARTELARLSGQNWW